MRLDRSGRLATAIREMKHRWEYVRWRAGMWKADGVPHVVKRRTIVAYRSRFALRQFVETGTFTGDMLAAVEHYFDRLWSVELSPSLHRGAADRFRGRDHIHLLHGDSKEILPDLLASLSEPALFWLDAHYSGSITARGEEDSPAAVEIETILKHPVKGHVVLIDDARLFDGRGGYPTIDTIRQLAALNDGELRVEVTQDIIRISGPAPSASFRA